jgi:hypothetical protein
MPDSLESPASNPASVPSRWQLIRDLAVFQVKLGVDALRDVALVPISLVAGIIDLLGGNERGSRLFYDVLHMGRRSEDWINLFGEADRTPSPIAQEPQGQTVDAFVTRVEGMLVEQFERGGMTAAAKEAIDRSLDAFSGSPQSGPMLGSGSPDAAPTRADEEPSSD